MHWLLLSIHKTQKRMGHNNGLLQNYYNNCEIVLYWLNLFCHLFPSTYIGRLKDQIAYASRMLLSSSVFLLLIFYKYSNLNESRWKFVKSVNYSYGYICMILKSEGRENVLVRSKKQINSYKQCKRLLFFHHCLILQSLNGLPSLMTRLSK